MAKKLINTTLKELQAEMSIAGDAPEVAKMAEEVWEMIFHLNYKQTPVLENVQLALKWIDARLKKMVKEELERQRSNFSWNNK